jgi:hypothetical protein
MAKELCDYYSDNHTEQPPNLTIIIGNIREANKHAKPFTWKRPALKPQDPDFASP